MSLYGAVAEAVRRGSELLSGETTLTASVAITTPFSSVDGVSIVQKIGVAPGLNAAVYTYTFSAGTLTIFAWQPTSVTNPTLVAATTSSNVSYIVMGRRRQ